MPCVSVVVLTSLTSSFDMDNSDGKASLKRQKSPETTTDTQGMSKFYWFYLLSIHISIHMSKALFWPLTTSKTLKVEKPGPRITPHAAKNVLYS